LSTLTEKYPTKPETPESPLALPQYRVDLTAWLAANMSAEQAADFVTDFLENADELTIVDIGALEFVIDTLRPIYPTVADWDALMDQLVDLATHRLTTG